MEHHEHTHDHDARAGPRAFPTETAGLPEAAGPQVVELGDGDRFELRIAPVAKRIGERHRAHGRLQRLGARPGAPRPRGLRARRRRRQRGRPRGDGALARSAAREPLRRHPRDAGADPGRRQLLLPHLVPGSGRLLVPPAHPRGLRPGARPVRQHPRRPGRDRLLAGRPPRAAPDARRRPDRGREDRAVQPRGDDVRRDGPLRQRPARRRRDRARRSPHSRARSFASTSRTRPTRASSTSPCRERS